MIGNVAIGVPANIDHLRGEAAERNRVAVGNRAVDPGDLVGLGGGCGDRAISGRLDRFIAAGMIGVPMGVPYLGDGPAFGRRLAQIDLGIGRVDAGGLAAGGIVEQIAIIVIEAGELVNLQHEGTP